MRSFLMEDEPAVESYFYFRGRWLEESRAVCAETWQLNSAALRRSNAKLADRCNDASDNKFYLFAVVLQAAISAVYFLGNFVWTPIVLAVFGLVAAGACALYTVMAISAWGVEQAFLRVHGLFRLCKHCHAKVGLPVYECPSCHARHQHLVPSARYGVLYRRCASPGCGCRIPLTRFNGRNSLPMFCRKCNSSMSAEDYVPLTLAFLGGPSVGKTMLFQSVVANVLQAVASRNGMNVVVGADETAKLRLLRQSVSRGDMPDSTQNRAIEAFCMDLTSPASRFPFRIYLYDPPGESFSSTRDLRVHRYYDHLRCAVWVIDPFSVESVRSRFSENGELRQRVRAGAMSPQDCLDRWLIGLEKEFNGLLKNAACAVAINKTDVSELTNMFGIRMGDDDAQCRAFLEKCACEDLVNRLERSFARVRFFAVSATGGVGEGQAFSPVGLEQMICWILENSLQGMKPTEENS